MDAKEDNLAELVIGVVGEAVYLHPVVPGEDVAGCFAEAQHMLRHDPNEQSASLQPGPGADQPLIFKTAVLIIMVIWRVAIEEVVTSLGSDQVQVTVMQDAGGMLVGRSLGGNELVYHFAGRLCPTFM